VSNLGLPSSTSLSEGNPPGSIPLASMNALTSSSVSKALMASSTAPLSFLRLPWREETALLIRDRHKAYLMYGIP
jgi:hypothetical protein